MNDLPARDSGSLPEVVWNHLKLVAAQEATSGREPDIADCIKHVESVILEVVGRADALPQAVVEFYAQELGLRISKLQTDQE